MRFSPASFWISRLPNFGWLEMDKAFDRTEIESPFVVFEGGVIVELASDESVGFRVGRDLTGSCF